MAGRGGSLVGVNRLRKKGGGEKEGELVRGGGGGRVRTLILNIFMIKN